MNKTFSRVEYIQLALEHKPLNLGQGFPDFAAPEYVTKALADIAKGENLLLHQYTRGFVSTGIHCLFTITCTKYVFLTQFHNLSRDINLLLMLFIKTFFSLVIII